MVQRLCWMRKRLMMLMCLVQISGRGEVCRGYESTLLVKAITNSRSLCLSRTLASTSRVACRIQFRHLPPHNTPHIPIQNTSALTTLHPPAPWPPGASGDPPTAPSRSQVSRPGSASRPPRLPDPGAALDSAFHRGEKSSLIS